MAGPWGGPGDAQRQLRLRRAQGNSTSAHGASCLPETGQKSKGRTVSVLTRTGQLASLRNPTFLSEFLKTEENKLRLCKYG